MRLLDKLAQQVEAQLKTPAPFHAWLTQGKLEKAEEGRVVGIACESARCPIATFLADTTDASVAFVDGEEVEVYVSVGQDEWNTEVAASGSVHRPLPNWAKDFVEWIDSTHEGRAEPVQAEKALRVLNRIKRGYEEGEY